MQALQLREAQLRQQASVRRSRSTNRQHFHQSVPAPCQNHEYPMQQPPIPPFQPFYGYPPYVYAPPNHAAPTQPHIRQPHQPQLRLPPTASDHSITPQTPNSGQRQPVNVSSFIDYVFSFTLFFKAPIRRTANSQAPTGNSVIYDKIRNQCAKAIRGVTSGYDAVCHVAFRQYCTFVKFKSGMVFSLLPQQLQPFINSECADTSVEFACEPTAAINHLDRIPWGLFLRQTMDVSIYYFFFLIFFFYL